jgi:hypothetical protein
MLMTNRRALKLLIANDPLNTTTQSESLAAILLLLLITVDQLKKSQKTKKIPQKHAQNGSQKQQFARQPAKNIESMQVTDIKKMV